MAPAVDSLTTMERGRGWVWFRRVVLSLAAVVVVFAAAVTWRLVDLVESELLAAGSPDFGAADIAGLSGGRVVLEGTGASREGVWGIVGADGYGQVTGIISRAGGRVERSLVTMEGSLVEGETVLLDVTAFPADPRTAHGLPFEEVRVPGELGVNPAWLIDGENDTWVVFVHGRGIAGRAESLRSLPTFRKLGFPILVITYRNDGTGGEDERGHATWGLDEWRDLNNALETAQLRGADDFILVGHDMGASIVMAFLHESEFILRIRGIVLDSAVLDLEAVVDGMARERGIPASLAVIGKAISRIRFGLEWPRLDQVARVDEFDPSIPMLLLHGTADQVAPIEAADAFAEGLPHARYERFAGAGHGALWNSESVRYDDVLTEFLLVVAPELALATEQ